MESRWSTGAKKEVNDCLRRIECRDEHAHVVQRLIELRLIDATERKFAVLVIEALRWLEGYPHGVLFQETIIPCSFDDCRSAFCLVRQERTWPKS